MNKALEQKLIGPMEESHTKEQFPQNSLVNGALHREIEKSQQEEQEHGFELRNDFFWR